MPKPPWDSGQCLPCFGLSTTGCFYRHVHAQYVPRVNWYKHPQLYLCSCRKIFLLDPAMIRKTYQCPRMTCLIYRILFVWWSYLSFFKSRQSLDIENRDQDLLIIQELLLFQIALSDLSARSGSIAEAAKVKIAHVERGDLYYKLWERLPEYIKAPSNYQIFHLHKSVVGRWYFITPMHE